MGGCDGNRKDECLSLSRRVRGDRRVYLGVGFHGISEVKLLCAMSKLHKLVLR